MLQCSSCTEFKAVSEFHVANYITRGRSYVCKSCTSLARRGKPRLGRVKDIERHRRLSREWQRRHRVKERGWITNIKVSVGCKECGERHPAVLAFHHVDRRTKKMRISQMIARKQPKSVIELEIKKCVVLCANCHAKLHWAETHV